MARWANKTDQDDWNIDHSLHQAGPRISLGKSHPQALSNIKTPSALPWPIMSRASESLALISAHGLKALKVRVALTIHTPLLSSQLFTFCFHSPCFLYRGKIN